MPLVQIEGIDKTLEFPDDTPGDVIQRTVKRVIADNQIPLNQQGAAAVPPGQRSTVEGGKPVGVASLSDTMSGVGEAMTQGIAFPRWTREEVAKGIGEKVRIPLGTTQVNVDAGVIAGLMNTGANLAEFATSPVGIATAATGMAGGVAAKVMLAGYAALALKDAPQLAKETKDAIQSRDPQRITEALAGDAIAIGMLYGGVKSLPTAKAKMLIDGLRDLRSVAKSPALEATAPLTAAAHEEAVLGATPQTVKMGDVEELPQPIPEPKPSTQEPTYATEERTKPSGDQPEHKQADTGGVPAETGGGDQLQQGGERAKKTPLTPEEAAAEADVRMAGKEPDPTAEVTPAIKTPQQMPESEAMSKGFTMRVYRGVSKSNPFSSATSWWTTSKEVAESYAEEVFGYEDAHVLEGLINKSNIPEHDIRKISESELETLHPDEFGNPQDVGIYHNSDDSLLGRSHSVARVPNENVVLVGKPRPEKSQGEITPAPEPPTVTPAIQTPEGRIVTGKDHVAAYETAKATGTPDTSGSREGFVDETGKFISREQAAAETGLPTKTEPGKLHSSDIPEAPLSGVVEKPPYTKVGERLMITPRTDGMVTLGDAKGNRIGTFKTVDEAAKAAQDMGYSIAPGSPLKPTPPPPISAGKEGVAQAPAGKGKRGKKAVAPVEAAAKAQEHVTDVAKTEGATSTLEAELRDAENFMGKASVEADKATREWGTHVEEVVNPLKAKIRKIQTEVGQMEYDAKRTSPEVKGKQHLTRKAFLQKYGAATMDEANTIWKSKNAEWADLEKQLESAETKRKELEIAKEKRGKEWSSAATRAGELRRKLYPKVKEGDVGKQPPISEGPGAASPGDVPSVQLEQLARTLTKEGTPSRWREAAAEAFRLGDARQAGRDVAIKALQGLKNVGEIAKRYWDNVSDLDDFKKILGRFSGETEMKNWSLKQFTNNIKRAIPKLRDREAIASYVDAGGDMEVLKRGEQETTPRYRQSYKDAQNLSEEHRTLADNIRNYFESRLKEAQDEGILEAGVDDYIHRIYKPSETTERIANAVQSGVLNTSKPRLAMKRLFDYDFEAEKAGLPIIKDFLPRLQAYEASLAKVIASRRAVKAMMNMKMADDLPMFGVAGTGTPIEGEHGPAGLLVNPHFITEEQRAKYVHRDYPQFKKWKWVGKDAEGNPTFVQGDVLVHKDAVDRVDTFLKPSAIRQSKIGRALLTVSSTLKQTMLDLSGFHQMQLTVHGLEHKVSPLKIVDRIDIDNPDVQGLLNGGMTIGGDFRWNDYGEGLWGRSLTKMIPGLGKLAESYHEWLFQDYIPRLKTTMALDALERNRARYPNLSDDQLYYLTAKEANAAFGGLNQVMLENSKTMQDAARLITFAPDFLVARGKFAAQAATKYGQEQRMALLLGATTMWVTARLLNKALDDKWHFEPENLFSVVYKNHAYGLRTVQGDILHLLAKPGEFWLHRLNPLLVRPLIEAATGRDYFGRKRTGLEQLADLVNTAVPISLRSNKEQKLWESILVSLGVTARKYSDVDQAYKMAQEWKKKSGKPERGEFIYDPDKDELRGLKVALWNDDTNTAVKEIKKLVDSGASTPAKLKQHFSAYAAAPFTGGRAKEKEWIKTLGEDDKAIVQSAQNHKQIVNHQFLNALGIYEQAKRIGADAAKKAAGAYPRPSS